VALEHEALKRGCKVCDVLRAFADSLDEQQEREFRLLSLRFSSNVNNVNSVHDKGDMQWPTNNYALSACALHKRTS
jgi:hypothetical protein